MHQKSSSADPYQRMVLHRNACFLCGDDLAESATAEHVFPKWLQHRHDLWNQQLGLLNETQIPYKQLTVPCCESCNGKHLSRVEQTVREAVDAGYPACADLDPIVVFQWLGKIFYGILRKELMLLADRSDPSKGTIVPPEMITGFNDLHGLLQSVRQPFQFHGELPFSVFVVNLHDLGGSRSYFFRDSTRLMTASLRTHDVGFIVAFEDYGFNRYTYGRYLAEVNGRKLHPLQFDELYAKVMYQVARMNDTARFITLSSDDATQPTIVTCIPSAKEPLPWNQEIFSHFLRGVLDEWLEEWEIDPDSIFVPPNLVMSWMTDDDNELRIYDEDELFESTTNPVEGAQDDSA